MGDRLKGKVAIVTGAGRGIGRGYALALAAEGAKVVVNDIGVELDGSGSSTTPASNVVTEIEERQGTAVANFDTVTTMQGGEALIKSAIDHFGRLDILVNNAGLYTPPSDATQIYNISEEEWDKITTVSLKGHFICTKFACQIFKEQKSGRIINNSSSSVYGSKGQVAYASAKAGVLGFTRTVARDMEDFGVTCNAIMPTASTRGTTGPEMRAYWTRQGRGEWLSRIVASDAEDIAPMVVYLCTDAAAKINGFAFRCVGGQISRFREPALENSIFKQGRWTLDELLTIVPRTVTMGLPERRETVNPFELKA